MKAKPGIPVSTRDVIGTAREAGSAIMQQLTSGIYVENKSDATPVTAADKMADVIIKRGLRAITPTIPILSEEDTPEERSAQASPIKWVVDPLDGTRTAIEYANGQKDHHQFGVHIALVQDGTPILGVAYFPAMAEGKGITYFTGDDGKAYKQTGAEAPKAISVFKPPFKAEGMRAAVHFHEDRRSETVGGRPYVSIPGVGGQRLCLVAEGAADIADMDDIPASLREKYAYKQWDLAASHAILKAAGGELVSVHTQKPVTYESADFRMPGAYAGGREVLKMLNLADLPAVGKRL